MIHLSESDTSISKDREGKLKLTGISNLCSTENTWSFLMSIKPFTIDHVVGHMENLNTAQYEEILLMTFY